MPKTFKVVQVTIRRATGVDNYAKNAKPHGPWMKELLAGVADLKKWSITHNADHVTGAHPDVDGHPGHVDGKDWKMNVERGNGSVDRLVVKVTEIKEEPSPRDPNIINVKIKAAVTVNENTH